jgi:ATP-dependent 26S proteasome regulatory subunit
MTLNTNINADGFTGIGTSTDTNIIGSFNANGYGTGYGMGSFNHMGGLSSISSQTQVLHQLQTIMQLQLFKNFSTGNFFIDTMGQLFLMTFITYLFTQIKTLLDKTGSLVSWIFYGTTNFLWWLYCKILNTPIKQIKNVDIPYISDNRKINELYKAVSWYLSTNSEIDYTKETDLQYVYEKSLVPENVQSIKSNLTLNKIVSQNKKKEIKFKNYIIKYELSTELVTVYTDREKKRENYKVKLWVEIDQFVKSDILEEFCQLCITKYIDSLTSNTWKQQIFINKDGKWTGENSNNTRKLETIILQNSLKDEIKDDFMRFINSEDWYNSLDIPFNRGYLFYGRPGTGKTSLIRGLSLHFKRHIHFLMLQNIKSDVELLELFKGINYKETILVIEDIDAMVSAVKSREMLESKSDNNSDSDFDSDFDSDSDSKSESKSDKKLKKLMKKLEKQNKELEKQNKQNKQIDIPGYKKRDIGYDLNLNSNSNSNDKNKQSGITLSGLLNALDGIVSSPGRILIMTTNHPEVLDDALVRPGRCDAKYQFDFCNKDQIKELFQMFFNTEAPVQQLANIKASEYSPAHITSVFLRYRNEPHKALEHLDDLEQKVTIKPLIEVEQTNNKVYTTDSNDSIDKIYKTDTNNFDKLNILLNQCN